MLGATKQAETEGVGKLGGDGQAEALGGWGGRGEDGFDKQSEEAEAVQSNAVRVGDAGGRQARLRIQSTMCRPVSSGPVRSCIERSTFPLVAVGELFRKWDGQFSRGVKRGQPMDRLMAGEHSH